jgi:CHAT domain-containing protein
MCEQIGHILRSTTRLGLAIILATLVFSPPVFGSGASDRGQRKAALADSRLADGDLDGAADAWADAAGIFALAADARGVERVIESLSDAFRERGRDVDLIDRITRYSETTFRRGEFVMAAQWYAALGDLHLRLANVRDTHASEHLALAQAAYLRSADIASTVRDNSARIRMLINVVGVARRRGLLAEAASRSREADAIISGLPKGAERRRHLLALIEAADSSFPLSYATDITKAIAAEAEEERDVTTATAARTKLGLLYQAAGSSQDAASELRRSVRLALRTNRDELLYRSLWELARVLRTVGDDEGALVAYRGAVEAATKLKFALARNARSRGQSFRNTTGVLFSELVDMLFERARREPAHKQADLTEIRERLQTLRIGELTAYFGDACVPLVENRRGVDRPPNGAAILYPVFLRDRVEVLLVLTNQLDSYIAQGNTSSITQQLLSFRDLIEKRTTIEYLVPARRSYDALIKPIESVLKEQSVRSLTFVLDGPMNLVPVQALFDGEDFLIQKYAVTIAPGVGVYDANYSLEDTHFRDLRLLAGGLDYKPGYVELPYVPQELKVVRSHFTSPASIEGEQFKLDILARTYRRHRYDVVHLASHAEFNPVAGTSVLVTMDRTLGVGEIDDLLHGTDTLGQLDLLVLSACDTAQGDDRAALGLAGLAIEAGARTVLASLWSVNDEATAQLMEAFYKRWEALSKAGAQASDKAQALQFAQRQLLNHPRFRHPGYWAPFLLIEQVF